jgi:hypothetical protein
MTLEDVAGPDGWERLHTTECSLCGAVRGEDYQQFAGHLAQQHEWADLGLDAGPERDTKPDPDPEPEPTIADTERVIADD